MEEVGEAASGGSSIKERGQGGRGFTEEVGEAASGGGGIIEAIGETIVEIGQTTKDMIAAGPTGQVTDEQEHKETNKKKE